MIQQTGEPLDVVGGGNRFQDRRQGVNELASEETEGSKRLYEEEGRGREIAIREQAGKAIQENEIVLFESITLPAEGKGMGEASPHTAPDLTAERVQHCWFIVRSS